MAEQQQCCKKMWNAVIDGDITVIGRVYIIYGQPDFADEDDCELQDIATQMEINYCPFCGKQLLEVNNG